MNEVVLGNHHGLTATLNAQEQHLGLLGWRNDCVPDCVGEVVVNGYASANAIAYAAEGAVNIVRLVVVDKRRKPRTPPRAPQPPSLILVARSSSGAPRPRPRPLPLPRPLPRESLSSLSFSRISSSRALRSLSSIARTSFSLALFISSFFSSTKVLGIPAGESWASSRRFQSAAMNSDVLLERKPVRLICILRGSGV